MHLGNSRNIRNTCHTGVWVWEEGEDLQQYKITQGILRTFCEFFHVSSLDWGTIALNLLGENSNPLPIRMESLSTCNQSILCHRSMLAWWGLVSFTRSSCLQLQVRYNLFDEGNSLKLFLFATTPPFKDTRCIRYIPEHDGDKGKPIKSFHKTSFNLSMAKNKISSCYSSDRQPFSASKVLPPLSVPPVVTNQTMTHHVTHKRKLLFQETPKLPLKRWCLPFV